MDSHTAGHMEGASPYQRLGARAVLNAHVVELLVFELSLFQPLHNRAEQNRTCGDVLALGSHNSSTSAADPPSYEVIRSPDAQLADRSAGPRAAW